VKKMPAGVFKTKCLAVMDEVKAKGEPIVITKHGIPVAKLVPVGSHPDDIYGFMAGKGAILGDIVAPVIAAEEWESLK
jgi:antitoxin (DNA-binding transcriptional repressor) of toxin-antitoxin stability system